MEPDTPGESDRRQVGSSQRAADIRAADSDGAPWYEFGSDHRGTRDGSAGSPRELCGQRQTWFRRTACSASQRPLPEGPESIRGANWIDFPISMDAQDQAERFYAAALGFQVETTPPRPSERWLRMISREEPD